MSQHGYFPTHEIMCEHCFAGLHSNRLLDLNVSSLTVVCDYLGIAFNHANLSEMPLTLLEIKHPGQWALEIASALGADAYLNPPGGRDIFLPNAWEERGIQLGFTDLVLFNYSTSRYPFIEHLSIIDVLMWNSPVAVKTYLDSRLENSPVARSVDV